jgi:hypothetical protein
MIEKRSGKREKDTSWIARKTSISGRFACACGVTRGVVLFCLGFIALAITHLLPYTYVSGGIAFDCFITLILVAAGMILKACLSVPSPAQIDQRKLTHLRFLIEALGRVGHPVGIASLVKTSAHSSLQDVTTTALSRITAGLRAGDYGTLPPQAVPALCNGLITASPKTVPVILQALTIVGDGRAIEKVEYLARMDLRSEIREAATLLLPILLQRDRESHTSSVLLRASHAPLESGQTLLRATQEQPTADPSQLLRMATPADSDRP